MLRPFFKYLFLTLALILLQGSSNHLFAQNYVFSNWTVEDGLSSNDVKDLYQDEDGFMWIATEHVHTVWKRQVDGTWKFVWD
jgi:ligand-binding sensor domain-containing protein